MQNIAHRLEGVGEYYFSKKLAQVDAMRRAGHDIINLGIGSPDLAPDPRVIEELHRAALDPRNHGYASYKGLNELLEAVARWYSCKYGVELDPSSEVLTLYGSKEGLIYLCQSYINPGDKVLVPNPGYPAYPAAVALSSGIAVDYTLSQEGGWMPDLEALELRADIDSIKMMIINYPHMPTGTAPMAGLFERLVDFARRHNILLVHDNPYSFIRNDSPRSLLSVEGARDVAVELNSLSKSHNMAGWRVGLMVGNSAVIANVLRYKSNLNNAMFVPLQRAAIVALGLGDDWYAAVNATYRSREAKAKEILETLGCRVQDGQMGLFEWGALPASIDQDCYQFIDNILETKDIFVTPGGIFGTAGERYIRVSLCASDELLQRTIEKLR